MSIINWYRYILKKKKKKKQNLTQKETITDLKRQNFYSPNKEL